MLSLPPPCLSSGGAFLGGSVEVGEPQRRLFTAIGTDDESYSLQIVGVPTNGEVPVYDSADGRWKPQPPTNPSFTVTVEEALRAASFVDQDPVGLGTPLQVTLGAPQSTAFFSVDASLTAMSMCFFSVDANGAITCLAGDEYTFDLNFGVGREGAAGESQIYLRTLINGVQSGNSAVAIVDNSRIEIPVSFHGVLTLNTSDVLTIEIARDTDVDNSGGLRAGLPDIGWNPAPSAQVVITRFVGVSSL